jgi:hypothetical protein
MVKSWRAPEMQEQGAPFWWPGPAGLLPAGHWVAQVDVEPGTDLAAYLGASSVVFGAREIYVRRVGWTRRSAQRKAIRAYTTLAKEATMADDTFREDEVTP